MIPLAENIEKEIKEHKQRVAKIFIETLNEWWASNFSIKAVDQEKRTITLEGVFCYGEGDMVRFERVAKNGEKYTSPWERKRVVDYLEGLGYTVTVEKGRIILSY